MINRFITILILSFLSVSTVGAEEFNILLKNALNNHQFLSAKKLEIEQARLEAEQQLLYENPSIEFEASSFKPAVGDNEDAYRVAFVQPIRLWGIATDKKKYADSLFASAQANYKYDKASFRKLSSLSYLNFVEQSKLTTLSVESSKLSKKIYHIALARYKAGSISKGKLLEAEIDYKQAKSDARKSKLSRFSSYIELVKLLGKDESTKIATTYKFILLEPKEGEDSPSATKLKASAQKLKSEISVNNHSVEWMEMFVEHEKEENQDITRVGVNIPLAIFDTKSEVKQISMINLKKRLLIGEAIEHNEQLELIKLKRDGKSTKLLRRELNRLLQSEMKLLKMFKDGYKIANINFLEMQGVKNKVIETKKQIIELDKYVQSNIINQNYLQGSYNE